MTSYILRRFLLFFPTLLGVMVINFLIIQAAPGGPVEQTIAQIQGHDVDASARVGGDGGELSSSQTQRQSSEGSSSKYRGAQGLDPELIAELERMYGFDKPAHERFYLMIVRYLQFDFGESFYRDQTVVDIVPGQNARIHLPRLVDDIARLSHLDSIGRDQSRARRI